MRGAVRADQGAHGRSVAIGRLERFVGDHAPARSPRARSGWSWAAPGRVAIVGSGPGLAAAADLAAADYDVTVFEALHVVGGVLRYGIPSFRLPRDIIEREVQQLRDAGVKFQTNKVIGKTFGIQQLMERMGFDAVFIAAGAGAPLFLGLPGESAGQVLSANEFLTRVNLMGGDRFPYHDTPVGVGGQRVMVIGAGNTAMDCLRTARRPAPPRCAASTGAARPRRRRAWRSCAMRARRACSSPSCMRRWRSCSTTRATCAA